MALNQFLEKDSLIDFSNWPRKSSVGTVIRFAPGSDNHSISATIHEHEVRIAEELLLKTLMDAYDYFNFIVRPDTKDSFGEVNATFHGGHIPENTTSAFNYEEYLKSIGEAPEPQRDTEVDEADFSEDESADAVEFDSDDFEFQVQDEEASSHDELATQKRDDDPLVDFESDDSLIDFQEDDIDGGIHELRTEKRDEESLVDSENDETLNGPQDDELIDDTRERNARMKSDSSIDLQNGGLPGEPEDDFPERDEYDSFSDEDAEEPHFAIDHEHSQDDHEESEKYEPLELDRLRDLQIVTEECTSSDDCPFGLCIDFSAFGGNSPYCFSLGFFSLPLGLYRKINSMGAATSTVAGASET